MKQSLTQERYAVFTLEVERGETACASIDDVVDYFTERIEAHPLARLIAVFDHHAHTRGLEQGSMSAEILAARSIILCFGITLPDPQAMALRPRSIGVCELADRFVLSFMEAPMPLANTALEGWALGLATHSP